MGLHLHLEDGRLSSDEKVRQEDEEISRERCMDLILASQVECGSMTPTEYLQP